MLCVTAIFKGRGVYALKTDPRETKVYKRLVRKLVKENLWIHVLKLLSMRPMYGRELSTRLGLIGIRRAWIYTLLRSLEKEGLIKSYEGLSGEKFYVSTEMGERVLKEAAEFLKKMASWIEGDGIKK